MVHLPSVDGIPQNGVLGEHKPMSQNNPANQLVLKGTTTIGVVCKDGVILASDTRVTMGYYIAHQAGKKVYKIDEHLGMTIAGTVADAQRVVDILIANAHLYKINMNRPIPVASAARLVANLLFSARYVPLSTQVLVGGIDTTGSHVFNLDPYGSLNEEKMISTGSGSPIALGVLEDKFKEDSTIAETLPVIARAVNAAMKRDVASGNSYNIIVINSHGYTELTAEEKAKLLHAGS
ncbi:MAG: archaeal proteasome endopeptidase complex subunit beta [Nitrososphaerota archaeon]|jgi:proteasome beta subunit|nr:archaeal proteasome endopeptidase complex subunit beta [Nitrososphaerota archaeon]